MIKFSEQQLKTPRFLRPVYLVTAGQSMYARAIPHKRTEELCIDAFTMAAELLDLTPAEAQALHTFLLLRAFCRPLRRPVAR